MKHNVNPSKVLTAVVLCCLATLTSTYLYVANSRVTPSAPSDQLGSGVAVIGTETSGSGVVAPEKETERLAEGVLRDARQFASLSNAYLAAQRSQAGLFGTGQSPQRGVSVSIQSLCTRALLSCYYERPESRPADCYPGYLRWVLITGQELVFYDASRVGSSYNVCYVYVLLDATRLLPHVIVDSASKCA